MATFKHIGDKIHIDDLVVPLSLFKVLEPNYRYGENTEMLIYNNGNLRVRVGGNTINSGGWPEGDRYISRKNDFTTLLKMTLKEESQINKEVESLREPETCRKNEYPTVEEIVVALWEKVVEKKSDAESGVDSLQAKRVEIKNKYPLKETTDGSDKVEGSTETVLPKGTRRTRNRSKHSG